MNLAIRIVASVLLLFNSIGACYGGLGLILYPDGSYVQLDPAYLDTTPFSSYLIPGIILFLVNGVFSFVVFLSVVFRSGKQAELIMLQGILLTGWIVVQVMLVRDVYYLHYVMGITGLTLISLGAVLRTRLENAQN